MVLISQLNGAALAVSQLMGASVTAAATKARAATSCLDEHMLMPCMAAMLAVAQQLVEETKWLAAVGALSKAS
jgi:hypothetical protein